MNTPKRLALMMVVALTGAVSAQAPQGGRGPQGPPPTPRAQAPLDLTGYWVSVVTEDWRWRMVTPQKGDYASVPLNAEGRRVADTWDLARDKASGSECKAFGAPALLRLPLRIQVTWQDDNTLKLETDAGQQTRLLHFGTAPKDVGEPTWQGYSSAAWFKQAQTAGLGFGGRGGLAGGNLKVVTTNLKSGYLRKNGVPYSEDAVLTEYFNRHDEPGGDQWITVTRMVEDAKYLTIPFVTSESFRKEPDGSKWRPSSCEIDPPRN
jgi:hypothetical protein